MAAVAQTTQNAGRGFGPEKILEVPGDAKVLELCRHGETVLRVAVETEASAKLATREMPSEAVAGQVQGV